MKKLSREAKVLLTAYAAIYELQQLGWKFGPLDSELSTDGIRAVELMKDDDFKPTDAELVEALFFILGDKFDIREFNAIH